jgi:hypothetical protein
MLRLAVEDEPALVFLQELPAAALERLEEWSGYVAAGAVAMRPRLPRELAMRVTDVHAGLLRSAVEGQANAILVRRDLQPLERRTVVLNPRRFRARHELPWRLRLAWAKERRVCHAVRVRLPDARTVVAANLHATAHPDRRLANAEVLRAAAFADGLARPGEPVVLAGDFNVTVVSSAALRALAGPEWGFSAAGPGIDHVLVRGLELAAPETRWPDERRTHAARLLSDHAPVEVRVE